MDRWHSIRCALNGRRRLVAGLTAVVFAAGLLLIAWSTLGPSATLGGSREIEPRRSPQRVAAMDAFVRREIDPLLGSATVRDRAAVDRALAALHERFEGFHGGVEPFVEDVTGWGTRFGVMGRSARDMWASWWRGEAAADAVRNYITAKFKAHVIDEEKLREAVTRVLEDFQSDLVANRNELFVEVRAALRTGDAPIELRHIDMALFERELGRHAAALVSEMGRNTIISGASAFTGSVVAEEIARRVALQIIARVATQLAGEAILGGSAAAGATVTGGATGGAGGTLGGPAGTVIGFGVGIAVGVAIDWWMTERFQHRLATECHAFLDRVESSLVEGIEAGDGSRGGLREVMTQSVELNQRAQRAAILARVEEAQR